MARQFHIINLFPLRGCQLALRKQTSFDVTHQDSEYVFKLLQICETSRTADAFFSLESVCVCVLVWEITYFL